jgi:hypothetical protein
MKTMKLAMLVILAVIFAGCQQKMKKDDVEKGVTEMFTSFQKNGIEKTLSVFADGYDKMSDNQKQAFQDAFAGKEFRIAKIEGDKVTAEVFVSPSEGGQLIVKTVIFKVIQVDGKIRVKDIINVIDNGGKVASSGPDDDVLAEDEDDLDSPLSEEHD